MTSEWASTLLELAAAVAVVVGVAAIAGPWVGCIVAGVLVFAAAQVLGAPGAGEDDE